MLKGKCDAIAIGSMPFADADEALDVVFNFIPNAPVWPQLSKRGLFEQMEIQYSEGIPRVVIDEEKDRMFIDTTGDYSEELAEFYEKYLEAEESGNVESMSISSKFSAGIPALEERLKKGEKLPVVKCQVTGPISFALTIVDENKRAIYYNEEFVDVVVKAIAMKARWQVQKYKPLAEDVICFVDEPILSAFGSSTYVSVKREDVVEKLSEVVEAIQAEGASVGIHCCGNTEWSILVDAGVDIINFDAFDFGDTISLYAEHMKKHLETDGKFLAWGIVPTNSGVQNETAESLIERMEKNVKLLSEKTGLSEELILEKALISPSCGTGSMEVADAKKVFEVLSQTRDAWQKKINS